MSAELAAMKNSSKTKILDRIREALRVPAPTPAQIYARHDAAPAPEYTRDFRDAMPPSGTDALSRRAVFEANFDALKGKFVACENLDDARERFRKLCAERGWEKIATHRASLCDAVVPAENEPLITDGGYDREALAAVDVGVSECECLVAQTGSVMFSTRSSGGRALSILPPVHVVIARREQLVGDLTDAYALVRKKYGENLPDCLGFITGPSRTGDIERILVLGAHGPKELFVFWVEN